MLGSGSQHTKTTSSSFDTFLGGSGRVWSGRVGLDDENSDNRATSVQLELELGLSLAKVLIRTQYKKCII